MPKKKKIFVSYHWSKDRHYKELLNAWSNNPKFNFKMKDVSTDVSINSRDASYIKQCIKKDIESCDVFLVPIGEDTHKSKWVDEYEIPKAFELNKPIVGVLLDKKNKIPESFNKYGDSLCKKFKFDKIVKLLEGKKTEFCKPMGINLHRIKCN